MPTFRNSRCIHLQDEAVLYSGSKWCRFLWSVTTHQPNYMTPPLRRPWSRIWWMHFYCSETVLERMWTAVLQFNTLLILFEYSTELGKWARRADPVIWLAFELRDRSSINDNGVDFFYVVASVSTVSWGWVRLVRRPLVPLLYQPRIIDEYGAVGAMKIARVYQLRVLGEILPQRHLVRHKCYLIWPVIELQPPQLEADDCLSYGAASVNPYYRPSTVPTRRQTGLLKWETLATHTGPKVFHRNRRSGSMHRSSVLHIM
jgi:hypothetical protein